MNPHNLNLTEPLNDEIIIVDSEGDILLSTRNELLFNSIRAQIKDKQLVGYTILHKQSKIPIGKDGGVSHWPNGMFSENTRLLNYLFDI